MRPVVILLLAALLACSGSKSGEDAAIEGAIEVGGSTETPSVEGPDSEGGDEPEKLPEESSGESNTALLARARQTFLGDLPELRKRRFVRVLIRPPSL